MSSNSKKEKLVIPDAQKETAKTNPVPNPPVSVPINPRHRVSKTYELVEPNGAAFIQCARPLTKFAETAIFYDEHGYDYVDTIAPPGVVPMMLFKRRVPSKQELADNIEKVKKELAK